MSNARHAEGLESIRLLSGSDRTAPAGCESGFDRARITTGLQAFTRCMGIVYDDQVMDRVFKQFCIGK